LLGGGDGPIEGVVVVEDLAEEFAGLALAGREDDNEGAGDEESLVEARTAVTVDSPAWRQQLRRT
jgi:hypothetical protein